MTSDPLFTEILSRHRSQIVRHALANVAPRDNTVAGSSASLATAGAFRGFAMQPDVLSPRPSMGDRPLPHVVSADRATPRIRLRKRHGAAIG